MIIFWIIVLLVSLFFGKLLLDSYMWNATSDAFERGYNEGFIDGVRKVMEERSKK